MAGISFAVVEFLVTATVAIINTSWFTTPEEDKCVFPSKNATMHAKRGNARSETWKTYDVRVLGKAATYERALEKLHKSEDTSDLQTTDIEENPPKRRKIRNTKFVSSSESESDPEDSRNCLPIELNIPPVPPTLAAKATASASREFKELDGATVEDNLGVIPPLESTPKRTSSTTSRMVLQSGLVTPIHQTPGRVSPAVEDNLGGIPPLESTPSRTSSTTSRMVSQPGLITPTQQTLGRLLAAEQTTLSLLEHIRETQKYHTSMLTILLRERKKTPEVSQFIPPEGAKFPMISVEDFVEMETRFLDPNFKTGMVFILGDLGGKTLKQTIDKIMRYCMRSDVGLEFNNSGAKGKKAFVNTQLYDVIYLSSKQNPKTADVTKADVQAAVASWLSGCRDRGGKRKERAAREARAREDQIQA